LAFPEQAGSRRPFCFEESVSKGRSRSARQIQNKRADSIGTGRECSDDHHLEAKARLPIAIPGVAIRRIMAASGCIFSISAALVVFQ